MDTLQWLEQLISFDTVSSNSNLPLINTIEAWFKLHGVETHIIPGDTPEPKANLFATIPAKNGDTKGGIVLSGHTDVVPVAGQMWDTDPFVATRIDNKIYGRGACDMKGFLAIMLALVPEFQTLNLKKPIHFSFTYDEEVGCIGVDFLLEYLKKIGIQPEGCIVGEPSSMRPITGEKARQVYHFQVKGLAAHSSLVGLGCNAIEYAARLICYINKLALYVREEGPFDHDFDAPYTGITTNVISGGTAFNVIPDTCEFIVEVRYLPNFPQENLRSQIENYIQTELLPEMHLRYPEATIYMDRISDATGFKAQENAAITRLVRTVTGVRDRFKVSYSTEASIFQDAHIPTIICGPGNIEQAHRPNEYVSIDQLTLCENVLRNVVHFFCVV